MANREFTITELKRAGDGGYTDTPVKFTWTNKARSAPRSSWKFGVQQRSNREDYPGVEQPVEQVLGPNYKDFTVNGIWDDRYNTLGYALETMRAFEALVQRGSLCRIEFETVTITGLIKDANFDYKRASYIAYEFTVSPHFRNASGLPTGVSGGRKGSSALKPANEYRDTVNQLAAALTLSLNQAPSTKIVDNTITNHKSRLAQLQSAVTDVQSAIDQRVSQFNGQFTAVKKAVNALSVVQGVAAQVMTDAASLKSSVQLAAASAIDILDFDTWRTSMSAYARKLNLTSFQGYTDLVQQVDAAALAIYRPFAGESLYSISQRFYGTPAQWQAIATKNGLTTMTLQGTETLVIPKRKATM